MQEPNNTELIIGIVAVTALFLVLASFIVAFQWVFIRKRKANRQEKKIREADFQKELLKAQLEIQEQTMKNISQEIHENIGQALSLTKLHISTMDVDKPEQLLEKIQDSKQLVSKAIQDLRDLSRSLHTEYITEMGLVRSIEHELKMVKGTGDMETIFNTSSAPLHLPAQQELILFRMVQEAISNIIKHAKATQIKVDLIFSSDKFTLEIADNGQGFNTNDFPDHSEASAHGIGLRSMKNRAQLTGASFQIQSKPLSGTTVKIDLPLRQQ